jgi:hypothetical protein
MEVKVMLLSLLLFTSLALADQMKIDSSDSSPDWATAGEKTGSPYTKMDKNTAAILRVSGPIHEHYWRSLIKFDLSAIPSNMVITKAELYFVNEPSYTLCAATAHYPVDHGWSQRDRL